MATLLTTSKMDPALVARIEASVSGRRKRHGGPVLAPRLVSLVRVGVVLAVVGVVYSLLGVRHHEKQEVTRTRAELLGAVHQKASSLSASEQTSVARAEAWLVTFSRSYDAEIVGDELRAPGALARALAGPLMYVRGAIGAFSSPRRIGEAGATSTKDALLLCLLEPPAARTEKELLGKVFVAYAGGSGMEQRTPNARRLWEAEAGLPILAPAWAARVEAASDPAELAKLKREYEHAPIDAAVRAARSRLLLVAMDEPGEGAGTTELDGERAHWVRLGLVELASERVLLSMRRRVDPSWISLQRKSEYAAGLDSCALAFDVNEALARPR